MKNLTFILAVIATVLFFSAIVYGIDPNTITNPITEQGEIFEVIGDDLKITTTTIEIVPKAFFIKQIDRYTKLKAMHLLRAEQEQSRIDEMNIKLAEFK